MMRSFAALRAVLLAGTLLMLAACGSATLGYEEVKDLINDPAPLQIWSGRITRTVDGEEQPVAGVLVAIEAKLILDNPDPTPEEIAIADRKRDTFSGTTDAEGIYRIYYRWYEDRDYTIFVTPLSDTDLLARSVPVGKVLWQDHDDDIHLDPGLVN